MSIERYRRQSTNRQSTIKLDLCNVLSIHMSNNKITNSMHLFLSNVRQGRGSISSTNARGFFLRTEWEPLFGAQCFANGKQIYQKVLQFKSLKFWVLIVSEIEQQSFCSPMTFWLAKKVWWNRPRVKFRLVFVSIESTLTKACVRRNFWTFHYCKFWNSFFFRSSIFFLEISSLFELAKISQK